MFITDLEPFPDDTTRRDLIPEPTYRVTGLFDQTTGSF